MEKEKDKNKAAEEDTSSKATIERGQKAVEADQKINKKDQDPSQAEKENKKDAEQWRNEG